MKTSKLERFFVFLAIFLFACLICPQSVSAQAVRRQVLAGHVPAIVKNLAPVAPLEQSNQLRLVIGLPLRNRESLTNLLQRIYDPASPEFHHYLTPAQFADSFGPTQEDYAAVAAFASAHALHVVTSHSMRTLLDVTGSVKDVETAFHVKLHSYRHPREDRAFFAPDTEPVADLIVPLLHIGGLDDLVIPKPMVARHPLASNSIGQAAGGSGPQGTFQGNDFRAAYIPGVSLTGAGQSVGLLEFDGFYPSDIASYAAEAGVPNVPLKTILLDGFSGIPGSANTEVALDIDMAVAMAPGLESVIIYEGQVTDDILDRMATDNLARQLSASWTYPIDALSEQIFQQFAAQGQSFFNASGDGDAWVNGVWTPSDDPNITIVGGTTLTTTGPGGAWVSETVWNWDVEYGSYCDGIGSSGGISTRYPIPSWQLGINMAANAGSATMRNVPDVALTADNIFIFANNGSAGSVGGTSCATPLWAAFTALVNQQAASLGKPPVGFLNPSLYAIGAGTQYSQCFHDIATGNNAWSLSSNLFYAVAGYDLCTGWGTPAGSNLVNLLVPPSSLQVVPSGPFVSSGGAGGPFAPTSVNYNLFNRGSASLSWAAGASASWLALGQQSGVISAGNSSAGVLASLNSTAATLPIGSYAATILFTNLIDGVVQNQPVTLVIMKSPFIVSQPSDQAVLGGATVAFTASAAGGLPMTLQWQFNGTNLTDGGQISGSQASITDNGNIYGSPKSVLTLSNVGMTNVGSYSLVASNAAGITNSIGAQLTITASKPVIETQPASQILLVGSNAQFSMAAMGSSPLSFQWRLNQTNLTDDGINVSGSATPLLNLSNVTSTAIGDYTVVVSNYLGSVTSSVAQLQVEVRLAGGQLVQNGGFETGDFSGWGQSGNVADCSVGSGFPAVHSGNFGALMGPGGSLGYLSQTLATGTNQLCLVSLWLNSPDGLTPNEFMVSWNGAILFDQTNMGGIGWTNLQFYVPVSNSISALVFGFRNDQSFFGLDDVSVAPLSSANGAPVIAQQPPGQTAGLVQGSVNISVLAAGRLPLSYQWFHDTTNLNQATNRQLTLNNLTTNQAGIYTVLVSNALGSTMSSNAFLTVMNGSAGMLTFDDLPGDSSAVPNGYGGTGWSTWNNFYCVNGLADSNSGFQAGAVSASNVAYNGNGSPAIITNALPFDFLSAYFTAAWNDNLRLQVKGWAGSTLVYNTSYTLSAAAPTLINLNYLNVTALEFITSGGTPHPGYSGSGSEFVMDNMSVVLPTEPQLVTSYFFTGPDGGSPRAGLVQGADGSFYGTTASGGAYGNGMVFRLTSNGVLATQVSFSGANGASPCAALVQGTDGNLYGTTQTGGIYGQGTVFRMTPSGSLNSVVSFSGSANGALPLAGLIQATDGNFYGTTEQGGANSLGTVFRMTISGSLTSLVSFNGSGNGSNPHAGLVQGADGSLYGTTANGGANRAGTVFRMTANGSLSTLVSFNVTNCSGPTAALVQGADGSFYGTTQYGGAYGEGAVFRVTTDGVLTTLVSFSYYNNGAYPQAGLLQASDGYFYGTTSSGGSCSDGTFFRISSNGAMSFLSFTGPNGVAAQSALIQGSDGNLYGTTSYGGLNYSGSTTSGDGSVFRLQLSSRAAPPAIVAQPALQSVSSGGTATFTVQAASSAPMSYFWERNGSPIAGATQSSYSITNAQPSDSGVRFSCLASNSLGSQLSSNATLTVVPANSTGPVCLFTGPGGGEPEAPLVQGADGYFYGTTQYGGSYGVGTVFRMTTNGITTILVSFDDAVYGSKPQAGLVQGTDGNFYGTTANGGPYSCGTVFRMTPNGSLTTLATFNYSGNGGYPGASLVQGVDGNFYGTTPQGGTNSSGRGTVFRLSTNGTLTTLVSFAGANGASPYCSLVQAADGNFYGTTEAGGTGNYGTLFRMTANGALTSLVSFDSSSNGSNPYAGMVQGIDGNLYGTTKYGGSSGFGTIFRATTNGALTTLVAVTYTGNGGCYPQAALLQGPDGNFYGSFSSGGSYGSGTLFTMNASGSLSNLFSFAGANGASPQSALVLGSDGNFYGTVTSGGIGYDGAFSSGGGAIFRLSVGTIMKPPTVLTQPLGQSLLVGGSATFGVQASGSVPLNYLWKRNGALIAGAAGLNCTNYTVTNLALSDSGSVFCCLVTNVYGSACSSNATLIVNVPPLVQNGGFELGTFADWTQSGNFSGTDCSISSSSYYAHAGLYGACLGPSGTLAYISQTLVTSIGQSYLISCWIDCNGKTPNQFLVSWNGSTLFNGANMPNTGWTNLQFISQATSPSTVLQLGFRDDPDYLGLDDIRVIPVAPPQFQAAGQSNNSVFFTWPAMSGMTYQLEYQTNLAQTNWIHLGSPIIGSNSNVTITDLINPSQQRFYRICCAP